MQDEPCERNDLPVVLVQAVERDVGHGVGRKLDQRYVVKSGGSPMQSVTCTLQAQPQTAKPRHRRLHQTIGGYVVGEFIVAHLNGNRRSEPAADLLVNPDTATDGVCGLFLSPVPVYQATGKRTAGRSRDSQRHPFH